MHISGEDDRPSGGGGERAARPAFLVVLGVVVLALFVGAAFLLGQHSGRFSLTEADRAVLGRIDQLGQERPSVMLVLESDDERTTLAHFAQQTAASDLSATSVALLTAAGEEAPSRRSGSPIFVRSDSASLSQAEREQAFLSECASWAAQVAQLTSPEQIAGLSARLRPALSVLSDRAREVGDLCVQQ